MTPLWWSILLTVVGVTGLWLAGRRSPWGWAISVAAQGLWIAYAAATEQWGFIGSALAYGAVSGRNLWLWRRDAATDKIRAHLAADRERARATECICPADECLWWECQIMACRSDAPCPAWPPEQVVEWYREWYREQTGRTLPPLPPPGESSPGTAVPWTPTPRPVGCAGACLPGQVCASILCGPQIIS